MGSVRKASAWLGLVEDSDDDRYYDDDYAEAVERQHGGSVSGPGDQWVTDPRVKVASDSAVEQGRRIATVTRTVSVTRAASASCSARAYR